MATRGTKLRVIRGAAPVRVPLADRCIACHGRRVLVEDDHIQPCPICCNGEPSGTPVQASDSPIAEAIARAA
jgi:hypothetical protein